MENHKTFAKIYGPSVLRTSIENQYEIYRKGAKTKIYLKSIDRPSSENQSKSNEKLWEIYRKRTKTVQYRAIWHEIKDIRDQSIDLVKLYRSGYMRGPEGPI